jgi:aspartyl-tRNA(Asn)/glutamyl-tRNA(Gln) amidotransferase subunit C
MEIREEDLEHLTRLARLRVPPEEREALRADLEQVLGYLGELAAVDTTGLAPMLRPVHVEDGTRPDSAAPSLDAERVLELGRARQDGFLRIPRTAGDEG